LDRAFASNPLSAAGLTLRRLSRDETVELEPALAPIAGGLAGALHYPIDETGNAYRFCVALAERAREQGVEFHFRTEAASLEVRSGRLVAVVSARERWAADKYVVAAGSYSTPLLRRAGVDLPVQPVKGYSVTIEPPAAQRLLRIPIVDDDFHAAVVPLEGAIRVAGTAEFAGYDLAPNPPRIRYLLRLVQQLLPQLTFEPAAVRPWWGLRPMSVDGVPIIGPTPIADLLVNAGHGHLGWTMAAGSAEVLADLIDGRTPSVDPAPYALGRFR
jgi:D-amino-acid dehydrogenase